MLNREIRSFTGIRAVALWAVILYHLYPHIVVGGYLGVVVFFVLSGYLLMTQHLQGRRNSLRQFKKQYIKLTPPLVFVVAATVTVAAIFFSDDFRDVLISGVAAIFGINNWQQIVHGLSYFDLHGKFLPFTHFWALSAQLQFYLLWAILRKFFGDRDEKLALSLAITGILSLVLMTGMTPFVDDATRVYYGTDTRFFSFALGALAGMIGHQGSFKKPQKDKSLHVAVLVAITIIAFGTFKEGKVLYYGGMLLFTLLTCALLLMTAKDDNGSTKALDNPVLRYFGLRSYELYLWQYPVMLIFQQIFSHTTLSYHVAVLVQLPVLFILAEGTYRLFHNDYRTQMTKASMIVLVLVGIVGGLALRPPVENEMVAAQQEAEAKAAQEVPKENAATEEQTDGEGTESEEGLSDGVLQVNEAFPSLALRSKDLELLKKRDGLMIGDSITEMTATTIEKLLPKFTIDGKKNRQMVHAKDILASYDLSTLSNDAPIVFQLGTNSDFNSNVLDELLDLCGDHPVFLMNTAIPDPWEKSVNDKFQDAADARENVHVIDWYGIAKEQPELFIKDHTHPKGMGIDLFAQTVAKHMLPPKKKAQKEDKNKKRRFFFKRKNYETVTNKEKVVAE